MSRLQTQRRTFLRALAGVPGLGLLVRGNRRRSPSRAAAGRVT